MIHLSDFFFFFLRCLLGWTNKSLRHLSHCNSLFEVFLSVAAVLCLLPLLLLGVAQALAGTPLVCLFSLSWGTCGFSALCHVTGCPSGVPHLADSGWLPYSCGDGFAWSWGCLGTDVLLPPCVSSWCMRNFPFRCFPLGVLHPSRVSWHV